MVPIEWLNGLTETRDGYRKLVDDAGGLPAAAWRLAQARCQTWEVHTHVPTAAEVRAAARTITRRAGLEARVVPSTTALATECEAMGLLVL